jgi:predicted DNA-binding transcriptional regulator AlpA
MQVNIYHERRLTLAQAAQLLGLHVSTIWRWQIRGVHGVRLETIAMGRVRYTSHEALERFAAQCTVAANRNLSSANGLAERQLAATGI